MNLLRDYMNNNNNNNNNILIKSHMIFTVHGAFDNNFIQLLILLCVVLTGLIVFILIFKPSKKNKITIHYLSVDALLNPIPTHAQILSQNQNQPNYDIDLVYAIKYNAFGRNTNTLQQHQQVYIDTNDPGFIRRFLIFSANNTRTCMVFYKYKWHVAVIKSFDSSTINHSLNGINYNPYTANSVWLEYRPQAPLNITSRDIPVERGFAYDNQIAGRPAIPCIRIYRTYGGYL